MDAQEGFFALRHRLGLAGKKVILGVSALWEPRKGLADMIKISRLAGGSCKVVLVGVSRRQKRQLPKQVEAFGRTGSVETLRQLYAVADVYLNPTYEDNYPTTNLEAVACGTPVVTYHTGGSAESARIYGAAVKKGDCRGLFQAVEGLRNLVFQR